MTKLLAVTFATFHGLWFFHVPHHRWLLHVSYGRAINGFYKAGVLKHAAGRYELDDFDGPEGPGGLALKITDASGCHRFVLPATFTVPKHRLDGVVTPCDSDSAMGAFVGRRR